MAIFRYWDLVGMINNAPSSLLEKLSCQSHKKNNLVDSTRFTIEMLI